MSKDMDGYKSAGTVQIKLIPNRKNSDQLPIGNLWNKLQVRTRTINQSHSLMLPLIHLDIYDMT